MVYASAFSPVTPRPRTTAATTTTHTKSISMQMDYYDYRLLDVPRHFFAISMFGGGIILSYGKAFGRLRMEERAWEQRLEEGRKKRLELDPTLTELDLRRREAALEWSAYGKPRIEEEALQLQQQQQQQLSGRRRRVKVMERVEEAEARRQNPMTDNEIDLFEREFGIDYDPYYDDPYSEEELPEGNCKVDKNYGDRIYDNGEIFYKDADTGLFFRQGSKPRSIRFFGL
jgi:hypothetical protein